MNSIDVGRFGEEPVRVGQWSGKPFTELMHWLYLPIHLPGTDSFEGRLITVPQTLTAQDIDDIVHIALCDYEDNVGSWLDKYVYVTARRGFATPDNPLNRVGWHTDGFGTSDTNYIWSDRCPTRWLNADGFGLGDVPTDHIDSQTYFETIAQHYDGIEEMLPRIVYRLSPYVVHCTPNIPAPGAMRSWVKVSISEHRYNLVGNSHNWDLDYDWDMIDRDVLRNDPAKASHDFVEQ